MCDLETKTREQLGNEIEALRRQVERLERAQAGQRQAEAALRESADLNEKIITGSPIGISIFDESGQCVNTNAAMAKIIGATREQVLEQNYNFIESWRVTGLLDTARRAMQERTTQRHALRTVSSFGKTVWVDCYFVPFQGQDADNLLFMVTDITERMKAEEALKQSLERLKGFDMHSSEGIYRVDITRPAPIDLSPSEMADWVDRYAVVAEVNDSLAGMYGFEPSEMLGRPAVEFAPNYGERAALLLKNPDYRVINKETVDVDREGNKLYLNENYHGIVEGGHLVSVWGAQNDITRRKRSEEERLKLERQLLHAQKLESLGVLAGGIAHDFNNILLAVLGYADLALKELPGHHQARNHLTELKKGLCRAENLTRQMLAYSGKGRFVIEAIDVSTLLEDMVQLLRTSMSRSITLNLDLGRSLPCIKADAAQMQQVVMNLITNAAEAMGDQAGVITLTTGIMDCDESYLAGHRGAADGSTDPLPGRYIFFEVRDTGCGMDEATRAKLFEPFFTTKFTGRGLGMAAVLGIVSGHRGAMIIDTAVGKGTTFRVLFPAVDGKEAVLKLTKEKQPDQAGPCTRGTILLVDDELAVREVTGLILEQEGFKVLHAGDGLEGVEVFQKHGREIDCVLLDLTMPRMNGEACLEALRKISADVRVILSSGFSEQENNQRFGDWKLAGFIQKPYTSETLNAALAKALGT